MRMTLTLDADVALLLDRTHETQDRRLKEVVNEALRRGLPQLLSAARQPVQPTAKPYETPSLSVGRCFIDNVDDVAAILAMGEGEDFK
jgi:hypothetical protein